jgi:hypothetical protein
MSFQDYMQGLEKISIQVTPMRRNRTSNPYVLEPSGEKTELRDSDYPGCMKRIFYQGTQNSRYRNLRTLR